MLIIKYKPTTKIPSIEKLMFTMLFTCERHSIQKGRRDDEEDENV